MNISIPTRFGLGEEVYLINPEAAFEHGHSPILLATVTDIILARAVISQKSEFAVSTYAVNVEEHPELLRNELNKELTLEEKYLFKSPEAALDAMESQLKQQKERYEGYIQNIGVRLNDIEVTRDNLNV
jgi:hypothetical protein